LLLASSTKPCWNYLSFHACCTQYPSQFITWFLSSDVRRAFVPQRVTSFQAAEIVTCNSIMAIVLIRYGNKSLRTDITKQNVRFCLKAGRTQYNILQAHGISVVFW
jgi:hypothetical protein